MCDSHYRRELQALYGLGWSLFRRLFLPPAGMYRNVVFDSHRVTVFDCALYPRTAKQVSVFLYSQCKRLPSYSFLVMARAIRSH